MRLYAFQCTTPPAPFLSVAFNKHSFDCFTRCVACCPWIVESGEKAEGGCIITLAIYEALVGVAAVVKGR